MSKRIYLLFITLLTLLPLTLHGQGFRVMTNRNDPDIKWLKTTTEHFELIYPSTLQGFEAQAAAIAESTYTSLSQNLDVTFDKRLPIYFSDRDDVMNGFATPFQTTFIWVNVNRYIDFFTDEDKWLRKLIAHELAHQFHFKATRSNIGMLEYIFNDPMPRFWSEGFAQYQTETWNAQRGDRWLRQAIFDDAISYNDGSSIDWGKLLYAYGHSQVRFFAEQYGDSTLAQMMKYRKSIGPVKYHDFEEAWKKHTGSSYAHFKDRWQKHINVFYNTMASRLERTDSLTADQKTLPVSGRFVFDVAFSPDTSRYAVLALQSMQRSVRQLVLVQNDSTRKGSLLAEGNIQGDLSWSPDGKYLAYSRQYIRNKKGDLQPQLFVLNLDSKKEQRLIQSDTIRTISPSFFQPDSTVEQYKLAFIGSKNGTANIYVGDLENDLKLSSIQQVTSFTKDTELSDVKWSPDGKQLISDVFTEDRKRGLLMVDVNPGDHRILYRDGIDDRDPIWSPDGSQIAFISLQDKVPNIWTYDLNNLDAPPQRKTAVFTGAELLDWLPADSLHPNGRFVVSSTESKSRDYIHVIDADRTVDFTYNPQNDIPLAYRSWQEHTPPHTIGKSITANPDLIDQTDRYRAYKEWQHVSTFGFPYPDANDKLGLFFTTTFQEPLHRHIFSFTGGFSTSDFSNESWGIATYVNNTLYPTLVFSGYQLPGSIRFYGNDLLVERQFGGDITGLWPHNINQPYAGAQSALRFRHVKVEPIDYSVSNASVPTLTPPQEGRITDLSYSITYRKRRVVSQVVCLAGRIKKPSCVGLAATKPPITLTHKKTYDYFKSTVKRSNCQPRQTGERAQ